MANVEDMLARFRFYSKHWTNVWRKQEGLTYVEALSTDNHIVFVSHSAYKTFARFLGSNSKGDALVGMEHGSSVVSLPVNLLISM